jgi:hypothetical protein
MASTAANGQGPAKEKRKLKGWRATVGGGYDHQFFNNAELDRLAAKEDLWLEYQRQKQEYYEGKLPKADFDKLTEPPTFTDEDEELKNKLLDEGWPSWNKKDFFNFVRMAEKYGRDGIGGRGYLECTQPCCKKQANLKSRPKWCFNRKCAGICYDFTSFLEALPIKTVQEILDYADAFWQHHGRIENG